ncbi:MAG: glycosyltransferase family 2 protein [Bacteroidetes bacterium QH_10_64_19]|nr:MAG: glycosyltransferase family 2 protein [Bacteroidetes bacterium QH_10_64_19]
MFVPGPSFGAPPATLILAAPRVSVVIVSWNATSVVETCLPSVVATDYPDFEIVFADNASTDGTAAWIAREYPEIKIVRHPENWLFCRGNNAALPHATGEFVVLLNNDVEVPADWLRPLVDTVVEQPDVAAVQPKMLQYDDARDVFWATGAALLLRRSALDEVGLLDERFEMHMEEIDLCWRLQRHGYRVRVNPESTVYHIGGASLPQSSPRKTYYNFRNSLLMLYKNLPPSAWRQTLPLRIACDTTALGRALVQGQTQEARAMLRAYRDAFRMRRHYCDRRPDPADPVGHPPYRGLAPVDYFLLGRQTFGDLPASNFSSLH